MTRGVASAGSQQPGHLRYSMGSNRPHQELRPTRPRAQTTQGGTPHPNIHQHLGQRAPRQTQARRRAPPGAGGQALLPLRQEPHDTSSIGIWCGPRLATWRSLGATLRGGRRRSRPFRTEEPDKEDEEQERTRKESTEKKQKGRNGPERTIEKQLEKILFVVHSQ